MRRFLTLVNFDNKVFENSTFRKSREINKNTIFDRILKKSFCRVEKFLMFLENGKL